MKALVQLYERVADVLNRPSRFSLAHWTVLLLVLGVAARVVRFALNFPLWGDEAFVAVNFLVRDYAGMIEPLVYGQIVPLGFMWANLAVTQALGVSEWAMRLLPLVAGVAALPLFYAWARRWCTPRTAVMALGFLAASYYPIRHACEVKPYSTDLFIGLLLFMAASWTLRDLTGPLRWLALTLLAATAVWCSYPAVFIVGGIGLALAVAIVQTLRARALLLATAGLLVFALASGVSWFAMYKLIAAPHAAAVPTIGEIDMWRISFPPLDLRLPLWLAEVHSGTMLAYPLGGKNGGSIGTLALVIIGVVALTRSQRGRFVLLLLAPLLFNFAAAVPHKYPYGATARTMLYMAPAFCLLAACGLEWLIGRLPTHRQLGGERLAAGFLAAVALGSVVRDVVEPFKKSANEEARRVILALGREADPHDQMILAHAQSSDVPHAPFMAPWGGDGAQLVFYLTRTFGSRLRWAPPPEEVAIDAPRTWVVFLGGEEFTRKHDGYRELFPAYASTHPPLAELRAAYLDALRTRLGPSAGRRIDLDTRRGVVVQALEIDVFGGPQR